VQQRKQTAVEHIQERNEAERGKDGRDRTHLRCRMSQKRIAATKRRAFPTAE